MSAMCHACYLERTASCVAHCTVCRRTFCQECDRSEYTSSLNSENQYWRCKSCLKSGEAQRPDGMGPYTTSLSPSLSLSSYGSCASNYGDIPADMNPQLRGDGTEDFDTGQKQLSVGITMHLEEHAKASSFNNNDIQYYNANTSSSGMRLPMLTRDVSSSNSLLFENHSDNVALQNGTLEGLRPITAVDDSDGPVNAIDSGIPFINNIEANLSLWIPPEPEDMEDEMEMESIVNDDDDGCDDYNDGINWTQSNSNSFDEEHENSRCYKEERQKAMVEAMNGQFKILVSRFLASEGISIYDGEDAESWLNIVASLSWEAALLVKPDVSEGRAMDPGSYIKVKCIATGARHQSQVIKGLVFKKNTTHKHMQAKFKNPRLLLIRGSVGHSSAGLSSFKSMEQEEDYLKSIVEMIETCHPNVVLVEKNVSRDIQEALMAKRITLVSDMKLPRLEKVARCTGSQIISSADFPVRQKLKHCDSFHIEKNIEEHNSCGEGSKKPIKTLMFLEGCPKPLGCTILLKGAHIDELKKVKRVMHYTVFAAYHLIVETSFFADQRAFFSDTNVVGGDGISTDKRLPATSIISNHEDSKVGIAQQHSLDIPISDGLLEKSVNRVTESDLNAEGSLLLPSFGHGIHFSEDSAKHIAQFSDNYSSSEALQSDVSVRELHSGQLLSSMSASLKKFIGDRLPSVTSESILSQVSFNETDLDSRSHDIPISLTIEALGHGDELNSKHTQEKPGVSCNGETGLVVSDLPKNIEQCSDVASKSEKIQNNDDIGNVLDSHIILVLFSSQCIPKKKFCELSHLSRIQYYGDSDTSLGRFLQDILLNQKNPCSCDEPPESHVYCYTHQNGNLTVRVKRLPQKCDLPGEAEGKVWMWTRCLKCDHESGIPRPTRRVVMSSAARGLSFGKFLELSFSSHCASRRLSRCGHSLHRDSLRFFGLGSKVAMFRYSPVEIYALCKPPAILEFHSPHGQEWLKREARDVLSKGDFLFKEVEHILHSLKPRYTASFSKSEEVSTPARDFSEFLEMLMQDKSAFEASLLKIVNNCARSDKTEHEFQSINWLKQVLLLELYVWDRRLRFILKCQDNGSSNYTNNEERPHKENDAILCDRYAEETLAANGVASSEAHIEIPIVPEESASSDSHQEKNNNIMEADIEIKSAEVLVDTSIMSHDSFDVPIDELRCLTKDSVSTSKKHLTSTFDRDKCSKLPDVSTLSSNKCFEEEVTSILGHMQEDHTVSATPSALESTEGGADLDFMIKTDKIFGQEQHPDVHISYESQNFKSKDPEGWIWAPLSELRSTYRKDLHDGLLQKFSFINCYAPTYLSPMQDLITQGMDLLYFPVGPGCNVISVSEDDISSIIACALALSEDCYGSMNNTVDKEGEGRREAPKAIGSSGSLIPDAFAASSHRSFSGSSESEGLRSSQSTASLSSDELSSSGSDLSFFVDRLLASDDLHPEIPIWSARTPEKSKYSVICIHAKQFYALRRRCCSSETAYISSLSSCKKWDAQGGKSKAFFAKTMDDRLIIKQIKKTELDSFLKFAPDYFKHIFHSLDSGSQTCLAKVLGIYQVRHHRNGKEIKTDLMVMENLLFGRNISRTYDLKGVMHSRYVSDGNEPGKVLLDENFVEDMRMSPIYIGGKSKHLLQRAIWNDTSFLTSINVMDYSLLVGVDKQRGELVFGIIDYLRQYTWDKQLETWVKASLVVPKNSLPTVISPKDYKKRFREFMTKYFLAVPDSSSSEQCSDPCKFCVDGNSSFNLHNAIPP